MLFTRRISLQEKNKSFLVFCRIVCLIFSLSLYSHTLQNAMDHAFILANLHENTVAILLDFFCVPIFFLQKPKTYLSPSIREVPIWGTQPSDGGWMVPHEWQRLRWEDWKTGRREWWYPGFRWRPGKWNVSKPWWWEDKSFIDYMSTGYERT